MSHDPLCPMEQAFGHLEPWEPGFYCCQECNPGMTDPDTVTCQCSLITRARTDERSAVIEELEEARQHWDFNFKYLESGGLSTAIEGLASGAPPLDWY